MTPYRERSEEGYYDPKSGGTKSKSKQVTRKPKTKVSAKKMGS